MSIPDSVKETVRGVLLSQTDGKGILFSQFLKIYKSCVSEPLRYQEYGFITLQEFIKAMPDIVRLEFSDHEMAYKMYGILKPDTFVSSFTKKASGLKGESEDVLVRNQRGHFTLVFPNKQSNGLTTKEAVSVKFSKAGQVAEINIIPAFTFVRYREKKAAEKALSLFKDELDLRVADERIPKTKRLDAVRQKEKEEKDLIINVNPHKPANSHVKEEYEFKKTKDDSFVSSKAGEEDIQVYMGNFPYESTEEDLVKIVKQFNPLRCRIKRSKSNHCKVFAFCDFDDMKNAKQMVKCLNEAVFQGRSLQVRFANKLFEMDTSEGEDLDRSIGRGGPTSEDDRIRRNRNNNNSSTKNNTQVVSNGSKQIPLKSVVSPGKHGQQASIADEFIKLSLHGDKKTQIHSTPSPGGGLLPTPQFTPNLIPERTPQQRQQHHQLKQQFIKPGLLSSAHMQLPSQHVFHESPDSSISSAHSSSGRSLHQQRSPMPALEKCTPPSQSSDRRTHPWSPNMPPLETDDDEEEMPPLEESADDMPELEPNISNNSLDESVQIFIGNFPYGTKEEDLIYLFSKYDILGLTIMNSGVTNRSTYAFAALANLERAQMAILELDQSLYKGRRLIVGMANPSNDSRSQNQPTELARITCTVGKSEQFHNSSELSSMKSYSSGSEEVPFGPQTDMWMMGQILRTYAIAVEKLRAGQDYEYPPGSRLTVLVTHVVDQKYFWGQVIVDSRHGRRSNLETLKRVMEELQDENNRPSVTRGLGRCAALYEGEWYRGWAMFQKGDDEVDVIYIDYGNTEKIPKDLTTSTTQQIWNLWPMAKPFCSVVKRMDLASLQDQLISLEMLKCGTPDSYYLADVKILD